MKLDGLALAEVYKIRRNIRKELIPVNPSMLDIDSNWR